MAARLPTGKALPQPLRMPFIVAAVAAAVAAGTMAVVYHGVGAAGAVDRWTSIALRVSSLDLPVTRSIARAISLGGDPVVAAGLISGLALLCVALGRTRIALLAIVGPGVAVTATVLVKPLVARTINGDNLAYPSGHTAMLTAVGLVVALLVVSRDRAPRSTGVVLILLGGFGAGVAMAWSQVILAIHYPTDTLGGICTAFALVPAAAWLIDCIADRTATRP